MKLFTWISSLIRKEASMAKETWLVVGLGNPGPQYAHTRHNVGFDVTDILAKRWGTAINRSKCKGLLAEVDLDGKRVVLCQPQTQMNLSGRCVSELLSWYKCGTDHLLIIYDDIDLPAGKLRLRPNGSAGTHNGMKSILIYTPDDKFPRLRVGVGAKPNGWDLAKWVLSRYAAGEEQTLMQKAFEEAADCVEDWLRAGTDHAMNTYNKK